MSTSDYLPIAVRAYTESVTEVDAGDAARQKRRREAHPDARWPLSVLIIDTETTTDATQRLTFGCYRYCRWTRDGRLDCVAEGLSHADDLPERDPQGFAVLVEHARARGLPCYSRHDFIAKVFYKAAYQARALVVGFNLPFDLSRIAVAWGEARGRFNGGFSFPLVEYRDKTTGVYRENRYRPRVVVKHMDSKRALKGFTDARDVDAVDRIPGGAEDGQPDSAYTFRGHFLDLRTLIFALTDRGHSLDSACDAFGVEHGKESVETHGVITPQYIDYNRRDVLATQELLEKVRAEYDKHPIDLQPTKAYSPASIAKAYLREMGVQPIMERQPDFPRDVLGYAMVAYYGGRAECRIRHTPVPVVYCDFLSMYPTVNALMGLWRFITAERIDMVDATEEVRAFLANITLDGGFRPERWPGFLFFAEIAPDGDVLPVRAGYSGTSGEYNIGVNPLVSDTPLWYAGPDLIVSTLLTGRSPHVLRAFRIVPVGRQSGLKPVAIRGTITVDPMRDDFFKAVIEERKRLNKRADLNDDERARLDTFLKVLANSGSYGIYAEMNRHELPKGEREPVTVYGIDEMPCTTTTATPEDAAAFCFPPLAALITAAARLMLAMLEQCITDMGGTYAFCDTDSMAPVATEHGGLIPCAGGTAQMPDGRPAIRALSWGDVEMMVRRFDALKPYNADAVPGHVLEVEKENFDNGNRRQLWCYGISAKRYALYNVRDDAQPILRKWSEHGLGHLLDPTKEPNYHEHTPDDTDAESPLISPQDAHDGRAWMRVFWEGIVREACGLPYAWPDWLHRPALTRLTISSPGLMRPFATMNADKPYPDQITPFNFILAAHRIRGFVSADGEEPHGLLIAPYETNARKWSKMQWLDRNSGRTYRITTTDYETVSETTARVTSYADVLSEYRYHPEWKSLAPNGQRNAKQARGVLQRRPVHAASLAYIGKESNKLEEVDAGMVQMWDEVRNEYADPRHDPWRTVVVPVLREMPVSLLVQETSLKERAIQYARKGVTQPTPENRRSLIRAAAAYARERPPQPAPRDDLAALAAYRDALTTGE